MLEGWAGTHVRLTHSSQWAEALFLGSGVSRGGIPKADDHRPSGAAPVWCLTEDPTHTHHREEGHTVGHTVLWAAGTENDHGRGREGQVG